MNTTRPIHEALRPLTWLIGKWVGENGTGEYPTIAPFKYCEELEFISYGQPLLNVYSKSWNTENKNPMHFESGFLRIKPGTKEVAYMSAHNFGLSILEEGQVEDNRLLLKTKHCCRMSFAKDPAVTMIEVNMSPLLTIQILATIADTRYVTRSEPYGRRACVDLKHIIQCGACLVWADSKGVSFRGRFLTFNSADGNYKHRLDKTFKHKL